MWLNLTEDVSDLFAQPNALEAHDLGYETDVVEMLKNGGLTLVTDRSEESYEARRKIKTVPTDPCLNCGKEIDRSLFTARAGSRIRKKYCSNACACAAYRTRRDGPAVKRECPVCKADITNRRPDTKVCSSKCRYHLQRGTSCATNQGTQEAA